MTQKRPLSEQELTDLRSSTRELGLHEATAEVVERALDELVEHRKTAAERIAGALGNLERLGAKMRESLTPEEQAILQRRLLGVEPATEPEQAKAGEALCGQKGCTRPAFGRYTWPGRAEALICFEHIEPLKKISEALGVDVPVIALRMRGEGH